MKNKPIVQFTMTTKDRDLIQKHADRARMTVSQFCKMVVFARVNNYPLKEDKNGNKPAKTQKLSKQLKDSQDKLKENEQDTSSDPRSLT